jgi:hypothetical protein
MVTGSDSPRLGFPASRIFWLGAFVVCAFGVTVFFVFDPTKVSFFPPCVFHAVTGWDCPGCGAQRSLHQLLHGNLIAAFRLNAMFVLSLPLGAWVTPRMISRRLKGEQVGPISRWFWVYLAAWMIFGLVRNLPFPIFAWFAA